MIQLSLLQRAKQGDPDAIAALMNLTLESRGVTATVVRIQSCLHVSFSSQRRLRRSTLVHFTQRGLEQLGITAINFVRLYGLKTGVELPLWNAQFYLGEAAIESSSLLSSEVSTHSSPPSGLRRRLSPVSAFVPAAFLAATSQSWQRMQPHFAALTQSVQGWLSQVDRPTWRPVWLNYPEIQRGQFNWSQMSPKLQRVERAIGRFTGSRLATAIGLVTVGSFITGGVIALMANSTSVPTAQSGTSAPPNVSPQRGDASLAPVRQAAAKKYLNKMTLAQQEFYRQQGRFARTLEELERSTGAIGAASVSFLSSAYTYKLTFPNSTISQLTATPRYPGLKSFTAVVLLPQSSNSKPLITTLCESAHPASQSPATPQLTGDLLRCPADAIKAR
jgi:hypothetical protein